MKNLRGLVGTIEIVKTILLATFIAFSSHAAAQTAPVESQNQPAIVQYIEPLLRLGDLYYEGVAVDADFARAFTYYSQAAAAGSQTGKIRMGEMLARGQGTAQDVDRGRKLVEEVAVSGNAGALVTLGDLYARGDAGQMNPGKAVKSYEEAASLGNTQALMRLGDLYFYGRFKAPNPKKALDYYRRAAAAGNPYGQYGVGNILAGQMVRKAGTPEEGVKLLIQAQTAGVSGAIAAISDSYLFRAGAKPNITRALAILNEEMQKGDVDAGRELVAIYRDGKRNGRTLLIKRNPPKARALYDQLKVKLSPGARTFEEFLLDVSVAPPGKYREYYDRLQKIHVRDRPSLVRQLRTINPGIYSYVVQAQLQRRGLLKGAPNGRMTANTVRVMRQYCGLIGTPYFCSNDPMSSQFSELLSYTF